MKRTSNKSLIVYCEEGSEFFKEISFFTTENPKLNGHKIKILQIQIFDLTPVHYIIEYEVLV